ncbi:MAG TPA: polyprenyl synthetase family protein [Pseudosphingobacterium sp.]|nr:polyprenyl synthetase family protein [Pseudosphingobacterium sp.]
MYELFQGQLSSIEFPSSPENLYNPVAYFMNYPGKRIRPALCLMSNELFDELHPDAYTVGNAIELFHNFTLVHDDIMDRSVLRRGRPTLHIKYGENTAILAGDILLIHAFSFLNRTSEKYRGLIVNLFSDMACKICEGQQMDIDFEESEIESIRYTDYLKMVTFKTSVLLGVAAQIGAIIGSANEQQQHYMYEFGKNMGIAFQIQDDFLDAFGETSKMGKQVGSDILENKKTALLLKAFEEAKPQQKIQLKRAMKKPGQSRINAVIGLYRELQVDQWASEAIIRYTEIAFDSLDKIDVPTYRKEKLTELANFLLVRQS